MIEILLDHSYEDDYFQIDTITVNIEDEKERIEKVIRENGLEGQLIDPDRQFSERIAKVLGVDKKLIDIDTNEIDI